MSFSCRITIWVFLGLWVIVHLSMLAQFCLSQPKRGGDSSVSPMNDDDDKPAGGGGGSGDRAGSAIRQASNDIGTFSVFFSTVKLTKICIILLQVFFYVFVAASWIIAIILIFVIVGF